MKIKTYYLGTGRKRNGSYSAEIASRPLKSWTQYLTLNVQESKYVMKIKELKKQAEQAGNLPEKLSILKEVSEVREMASQDPYIGDLFATAVRECII